MSYERSYQGGVSLKPQKKAEDGNFFCQRCININSRRQIKNDQDCMIFGDFSVNFEPISKVGPFVM